MARGPTAQRAPPPCPVQDLAHSSSVVGLVPRTGELLASRLRLSEVDQESG